MEMHYEREFLALAKAGSFNKAAEELFTVESSLSRHIRSLEEELGAQLVVRTRQGITLTHIGELYRDYAARRMQIEDEFLEAFHKETDFENSTLRIMTHAVLAKYRLQDDLDRLCSRYPSIHLKIQADRSARLLPSLEDGKSDVVVTREPRGTSDMRFSRILYKKERVYVILPEKDAVVFPDSIPLEELEKHPLLVPEEANATIVSLFSACRAGKCMPKQYTHVYPTPGILDRVSLGMGWGIVPQAWADILDPNGKIFARPIAPDVWNELNFVYLPSSNLKLREFLRALRKCSF